MQRLKNYPDPEEVIGVHGADALRLYLIGSPAARAEPVMGCLWLALLGVDTEERLLDRPRVVNGDQEQRHVRDVAEAVGSQPGNDEHLPGAELDTGLPHRPARPPLGWRPQTPPGSGVTGASGDWGFRRLSRKDGGTKGRRKAEINRGTASRARRATGVSGP